MDRLSPSQRSVMMARVRSKNTQPEMRVRRIAHSMGFRFRLHRRDLAGTPDLVFPKHKLAIFVHGCFWHQHPGCKRASMPSSHKQFWGKKLGRNVERDLAARAALQSKGWRTEIIWECETKSEDELRERLEKVFGGLVGHASVRAPSK